MLTVHFFGATPPAAAPKKSTSSKTPSSQLFAAAESPIWEKKEGNFTAQFMYYYRPLAGWTGGRVGRKLFFGGTFNLKIAEQLAKGDQHCATAKAMSSLRTRWGREIERCKPLLDAVESNNLDRVKAAVDSGMNINEDYTDNLLLAAAKGAAGNGGNIEVYKYIYNNLDKKDPTVCLRELLGGSAFGLSCASMPLVNFLVEQGAKIKKIRMKGMDALSIYSRHGRDFEVFKFIHSELNVTNHTPYLFDLVVQGYSCQDTGLMIDFLVQKGADIHARNDERDTPLLIAIKSYWRDLTNIEALLKAGAKINAVGSCFVTIYEPRTSGGYFSYKHPLGALELAIDLDKKEVIDLITRYNPGEKQRAQRLIQDKQERKDENARKARERAAEEEREKEAAEAARRQYYNSTEYQQQELFKRASDEMRRMQERTNFSAQLIAQQAQTNLRFQNENFWRTANLNSQQFQQQYTLQTQTYLQTNGWRTGRW